MITKTRLLIKFSSGLMERDDWKNLGLSNVDKTESEKNAPKKTAKISR